jgi:uncharacterized protein YegP (UPF0339 family)
MYFYLFQDANSQWRWNYRSANHKIIADSAESYVSKSDALLGISLMLQVLIFMMERKKSGLINNLNHSASHSDFQSRCGLAV